MVPPEENEEETQIRKTVPSLSLAIVLKKNLKSCIREMLTTKHRKQICCIKFAFNQTVTFQIKTAFYSDAKNCKAEKRDYKTERVLFSLRNTSIALQRDLFHPPYSMCQELC